MLRMLYSSNAFWSSSGYGVQGKSLLPRLANLPEFGGRENIAQFAWYGLQGGVHNVDGFTVYPAGAEAYGNDVIESHTKDFRANLVVSLIDVWVMHDTAVKVAPALWCPWLPIDHDPVPEPVINSLRGAYRPLTYSKWGNKMLSDIGIENTYIPHGIEPSIYHVLPTEQAVQNFKREVLRCDGHLSVMVAANKGYPDRKAFQVQMRAWGEWAKDKPDAKLYLHTEPTQMYGGPDLPKLAQALGIDDKILFPERYQYFKGLPSEFMAFIYNAADVLLSASMSEGFGIPIIEAQACGTPVIVSDFSAMPELVRWGYAVTPADLFWTPMNAWQCWPSASGIVAALDSLYDEWLAAGKRKPADKRAEASALIHDEYSWDTIVVDHWAPFLAEIDQVAPPIQPARPTMQRTPPPRTLPRTSNGKQEKLITPAMVGIDKVGA